MAVTFDSVGAGTTGIGTSPTWTDSATAGAYAIAAGGGQSTLSAATYGGASMSDLGDDTLTGAQGSLYGLSGVASGSQTVTLTQANTWYAANSVTYLNVSSVSAAQFASGTGTSASQSVTCSAGQMIVQAFFTLNAGFTPSGGTNRYNGNSSGFASVTISDATSNTTFTATLSSSQNWVGIAVVLSPSGGAPPDPGLGARLVPQIPNRFVGPTALRNKKRMPQPYRPLIPYRHVDGANSSWKVSTAPAPLLPNPFANVIQKLNAGQSVNIQALGDSTCHGFGDTNGSGGWVAWLGTYLGIYYNVNVNYYDVSPGTGYTLVPAESYTASGTNTNTISMFNGGINGSGFEGFGNEEYYMVNGGLLACQFGFPIPDACFVYNGINDISNGTSITSSQWVADVKTYLTGVGTGDGGVPAGYPGLQHYIPGVPIIYCPQHYSWTITNFATAYYPYQSAVAAALTLNGNSLPLTPAAQPGLNDVWVLDTQQSFTPTAFTQSQIMSGTNGNGDPHPNDFGYQVIATWMLSQLAPFMSNAGYSYSAPRIPNPMVGPMALRNQKRMPSVNSRSATFNNFSDGANVTISWATADDGFLDHPGAKTSVIIPNRFVGPTALRQGKRQPYVGYRSASFSDGANQTITFTTPTNGRRGITDGANQTIVFGFSTQGVRGARDGANSIWTFTTSDDGFIDHPGAKTSIIIPNPNVGPMALRNKKRLPYVAYVHASGQQGFSDGANSAWVFTTSDNGHRGITDAANSSWTFTRSTGGTRGVRDGANQTITFTASTQGVRGVRDGANVTITFIASDDGFIDHPRFMPLIIPNPFVGPMAMRNRKRMPYRGAVSFGHQALTDGANSNWVFSTSANGHRGITATANTTIVFSDTPAGVRGVRDGANVTITASFVASGHRGIHDGANQTITVHCTPTGKQGFHDGANLHLVFVTSDDGFIHPFLIDVAGTVIVGPNEIRSVTLPPSVFNVIVSQQNVIEVV